MQVRDVMNKSVRAVRPDTRVMEVASLMCLYRYHGLPVTEEDGTLIGFIAEKDLLHHLFPTFERLMEEGLGNVDLDLEMGRYAEVLDLYVSDLMTRNPIAVTPDMHVLRATTIMVRNKFRRIPVAENGVLVGVLSLGDVHKAIFHANVAGTLKSR